MMRAAVAALTGTLFFGCASLDDGAPAQVAREYIVVSGVVKVTGSKGPDLRLILGADDGRSYEIVGDLAEEIWKLQQKRISVRGWVVEEPRVPGIPPRLQVIAMEGEDS